MEPRYRGIRAVAWLVRNQKIVMNYFVAMFGVDAEETVELKNILDGQSNEPDRTAFKYECGRFVRRHPYYMRVIGGRLEVTKHPWHYILFSQFRLYHFFIGGVWHHLDKVTWVRMEDYSSVEFCSDHSEMQPCEFCKMIDNHD